MLPFFSSSTLWYLPLWRSLFNYKSIISADFCWRKWLESRLQLEYSFSFLCLLSFQLLMMMSYAMIPEYNCFYSRIFESTPLSVKLCNLTFFLSPSFVSFHRKHQFSFLTNESQTRYTNPRERKPSQNYFEWHPSNLIATDIPGF